MVILGPSPAPTDIGILVPVSDSPALRLRFSLLGSGLGIEIEYVRVIKETVMEPRPNPRGTCSAWGPSRNRREGPMPTSIGPLLYALLANTNGKVA